ncbi:MAG: hypothetical protein OIF51_17415, partial [Cellvibrionaceae bacterium]|nr:hypothetical protein [Cellvibrionaceae bacterium]
FLNLFKCLTLFLKLVKPCHTCLKNRLISFVFLLFSVRRGAHYTQHRSLGKPFLKFFYKKFLWLFFSHKKAR